MTMAIEVRGLRKRYGDVCAVDGIDFRIRCGEVFALLGPNGAGKTTTVEVVAGFRRRDAGTVVVLGEDPQRAGIGWRRGIGVVFQDVADAAELTVIEMLQHFATYYPGAWDPGEVLDLVGLRDKERSRVRTLSGGQRRRLDVAVGVIGRPRLLFLDEPTTGFDPQARRRFWALIRSLATAGGTTILLTTHYLDEAEALADRVAVIAGGRIVASGDPASFAGRATAEATVSWRDGDTPRTARTADPGRLVAELTARHRGTPEGLTVTRPTLEDVYLSLIGGTK
ncbi:ABC transporter ATP-binding protein [Micromonosporaceae bacterium B7E4]